MATLEITALPAIRRHGITEIVEDETEIPDAVGRLLTALSPDADPFSQDVFLSYDGTTDDTVIVVSAAVPEPSASAQTQPIEFAAAEPAAVVRLDERPNSTADAWVALDAELETRGLRSIGPFHQTFHADGTVTLSTPVGEVAGCG